MDRLLGPEDLWETCPLRGEASSWNPCQGGGVAEGGWDLLGAGPEALADLVWMFPEGRDLAAPWLASTRSSPSLSDGSSRWAQFLAWVALSRKEGGLREGWGVKSCWGGVSSSGRGSGKSGLGGWVECRGWCLKEPSSCACTCMLVLSLGVRILTCLAGVWGVMLDMGNVCLYVHWDPETACACTPPATGHAISIPGIGSGQCQLLCGQEVVQVVCVCARKPVAASHSGQSCQWPQSSCTVPGQLLGCQNNQDFPTGRRAQRSASQGL